MFDDVPSDPSADGSSTIVVDDPSAPTSLPPAPDFSGEPNPFEEDDKPSTADAYIDPNAAGVHPVVSPSPIAAFFANKRNVAIAGAVALGIVAGLALALGAGGDEQPPAKPASVAKQDEGAAKPTVATPEPTAAEEPTSDSPEPTEPTAIEPEPLEPEPTEPEPSETTEPSESAGSPESKPKKAAFGGKQIVLEYDTQAREAKPVPNAARDDQAAIARARAAYAAGNQRLFAGDSAGAIQQYRRSLAHYPAYVAGYRGLGLAYAQRGDKANALRALRTYVNSVPNAKDAALIRKRIQMLSQ